MKLVEHEERIKVAKFRAPYAPADSSSDPLRLLAGNDGLLDWADKHGRRDFLCSDDCRQLSGSGPEELRPDRRGHGKCEWEQ